MKYTLVSYDPVSITVKSPFANEGDSDSQCQSDRMANDDPYFEQLVLMELSKRLQQAIDAGDVPKGDTIANHRVSCAVDALADHLDISVSDNEMTDLIPCDTQEERAQVREQIEQLGMHDMLMRNIAREKALRWLLDNSEVLYA